MQIMNEMDDMAAFTTKRVVEYMEMLHISVNKLQQDTGVARSTITRYMHGTTMPSLYFLGKFLNYIEVDAAEFYEPYVVNKKKFVS